MEKTKVFESRDPLDLIADPKLARLLGVSLRTLARWDADPDNDFPAPVILNGRKYRRRGQVEAWLHERALTALTAPTSPSPSHMPGTAIVTEAPAKKPGKTRSARGA
jgi:hypothetical protein